MKRSVRLLLAVMAGIAAARAGAPADQRDSLSSLLPASDSVQGWSRTDSVRVYAGRALYLFMDGGADLFIEYGFRQAAAVEYRNGGDETIDLEIHEMDDAGAAFGIYSVRSGGDANPLDIGDGGSAHAYYVMFWKGRFYVSIAASDSSPACRKGLEAIARGVDRNLIAQGHAPAIMGLLPRDSLVSERYFRGSLGLSSARLPDMKGLFPATDGAAGIYDSHAMILLAYGTRLDAEERMVEITENLRSDERFRDFRERDRMAMVVDRKNQTLCLYQSGQHIIISISPQERLAESSCLKALAGLSGR